MHLYISPEISSVELENLRKSTPQTFPWKKPDSPRLERTGDSVSDWRLVWELSGGEERPADPRLVEDLLATLHSKGVRQAGKVLTFVKRHGPLFRYGQTSEAKCVRDYLTTAKIVETFVRLCRPQESQDGRLRREIASRIGLELLDRPDTDGLWFIPNRKGHLDYPLAFALIGIRGHQVPTSTLLSALVNQWAYAAGAVPALDMSGSPTALRWPGTASVALTVTLQQYLLHEHWTVFCDFCREPIVRGRAPKLRAKTHCCTKMTCRNRRARLSNRASRARHRGRD